MVLRQEVKTQTDNALELNFISYQMVGGCHHDIGIRATALDVISGVCDARGRITACRLAKHLVVFQHGQVFKHQMLVGFVGHHEKVLVGDDGAEALIGATDEALSRA